MTNPTEEDYRKYLEEKRRKRLKRLGIKEEEEDSIHYYIDINIDTHPDKKSGC